jgi:hypothetical protein
MSEYEEETNSVTFNKINEINNYFIYEPKKIDYLLVKINNSSCHTININNVIYYDTIISNNTVLCINKDATFVVKRSLKNYGTIINNGRLIIDSKHNLNSYFANYGKIINNGSLEIYGVFDNMDKGSIISNMIKNYGIFNNDGSIENNKLIINDGVFNNNNLLVINGELSNSYIFHNRKQKKISDNMLNNITKSYLFNHGKITNTHIIHNETLIYNTYHNAFTNFNIIINTGSITNYS